MGFPVRSGHTHLRVPPVLENLSVLVEALPIELAVVLETTSHMPALATDILDEPLGSIPTVELDIDLPAWGQQGAQRFQDLPS